MPLPISPADTSLTYALQLFIKNGHGNKVGDKQKDTEGEKIRDIINGVHGYKLDGNQKKERIIL